LQGTSTENYRILISLNDLKQIDVCQHVFVPRCRLSPIARNIIVIIIINIIITTIIIITVTRSIYVMLPSLR